MCEVAHFLPLCPASQGGPGNTRKAKDIFWLGLFAQFLVICLDCFCFASELPQALDLRVQTRTTL
jgi:hypothetical protein